MVNLTVIVNNEAKMQDALIDYAYPCMMAEKALKNLHDAMLLKKYDEALEQGIEAAVQVKLTLNSIRHMMEQDK